MDLAFARQRRGLLAFVVSRTTRRHVVTIMIDPFSAAFGTPSQQIFAEMTYARMMFSHALSPPHLYLRSLKTRWASSMKPCPNVNFSGATCSRCPHSLEHAQGITFGDGDGDDEHSLARKRTKVQGIIGACVDTGIKEGVLQIHEVSARPTRGLSSSVPRRRTTPGSPWSYPGASGVR